MNNSYFEDTVNTNNILFDYQQSNNFIRNAILSEKLKGMVQDRILRLIFSIVVFVAVCIYMCCVLNIVNKCGNVFNMFVLSDGVLITLLSTTTANIVGLLAFVVRYLFPQKQGNETEVGDSD